jgi:hypothetical protein
MTWVKIKEWRKHEIIISRSKIAWKPNRKKRKTSIVLHSIPQLKLPGGRRYSTESTEIAATLANLTDIANMPGNTGRPLRPPLSAPSEGKATGASPQALRHSKVTQAVWRLGVFDMQQHQQIYIASRLVLRRMRPPGPWVLGAVSLA